MWLFLKYLGGGGGGGGGVTDEISECNPKYIPGRHF